MTSLCGLYVLFVSFFVVYGQNSHVRPWWQCPAEQEERWTYRGPKGPQNWGLIGYPNCNGRQQSPIEIVSDEAKKDGNLARLTLNNYDRPILAGQIENNGHTIEVTPKDDTARTIYVNGVNYTLRQFHFHWGDNNATGSEHTLDGIRYTMEMHLVHMNENNSEIAVVGIFLQEAEGNNEEIQNVVNQLPDVKYKDEETELKSDINLNNLLPANPTSYFRYQGSLTTPPCTEGVTWSVVPNPIPVGKAQMKEFRNLYSIKKQRNPPKGCKLVNNFRPTQPLYDRPVYLSQ